MKRFVLIFSFCLLPLLSSAQYWDQGKCEQRLRKHIGCLSADSLMGRRAGSEGETRAAVYLYDRLKEAGVQMISPRSGQDFFIAESKDTLHSRNVVGIVEGYDSRLRNQYVLLGANIDHLGTNTIQVNGRPVMQIYPGANDNASGIAALIEIAGRIASSSYMFRRSVIFAGFGAKEMGMAGSWYFVNRAFDQVDSISLMVNLNAIGKSGMDHPFSYGTGVPSPEVYHLVGLLAQSSVFYVPQLMEGSLPSADYLPFYERGIPVAFFTTGRDAENRTQSDVAARVDCETMEFICDFIYNLIREVANMDLMINRSYAGPVDRDNIDADRIYSPYEVDKAPEFFKGDERTFLRDWVYSYLKYPEIAITQGIQGVVIVEFIVEKDGRVTHVKAVRGEDQSLEDEAVRVISASPKWKSGVLGGEKVRVKYSIPVEFKLRKR